MSSRTRQAERGAASRAARLPLPVVVFMIALVVPFIISVGELRLSVYRICLLVMIVPLVFSWLSGRAGRIRTADLALFLACAWATVSFSVLHGLAVGVELGGIFFAETMGAYLLARCGIRNADQFFRMARLLFWIILFLLPFAIVETVTSRNLLLQAANAVWHSQYAITKDPRWGLFRVQTTFEHPILYGAFCGSAVGLAWMVLGHGRSLVRRAGGTLLVLVATGLSLSSGILTGVVAQILLIGWNATLKTVRGHWLILAGLVAAAWIFLEFAANRPPAVIFINYFSFDQHSAYMRVHIWNFTTASIAEHPLFGTGFDEWARPSWMRSSIDMFWVLYGVRNGLPAQLALGAAFFAAVLPLAFRRGLDPRRSDYRLGLVLALVGFFLSGWTTSYWNATYVWFVFLLGSGAWLLDAAPDRAPAPDPERRQRSARRRPAWAGGQGTMPARDPARTSLPARARL